MSPGRTEEQEKEKRGKRGATTRRDGVKDERGSALFDNGRPERNKNKHSFLQSRCPLPVCAPPVLPGGLSFIDKHLEGGGVFYKVTYIRFSKTKAAGGAGGVVVVGGGCEGKGGSGEDITKSSRRLDPHTVTAAGQTAAQ